MSFQAAKNARLGHGNRLTNKTQHDFVALQLVHFYNKGCERNDHSLFHYGFLQDREPPRLAVQDLLGGDLYSDPVYGEADYGARPLLACPLQMAACMPTPGLPRAGSCVHAALWAAPAPGRWLCACPLWAALAQGAPLAVPATKSF
jgi:hypothetical protein